MSCHIVYYIYKIMLNEFKKLLKSEPLASFLTFSWTSLIKFYIILRAWDTVYQKFKVVQCKQPVNSFSFSSFTEIYQKKQKYHSTMEGEFWISATVNFWIGDKRKRDITAKRTCSESTILLRNNSDGVTLVEAVEENLTLPHQIIIYF